jgi:hypothetical protein
VAEAGQGIRHRRWTAAGALVLALVAVDAAPALGARSEPKTSADVCVMVEKKVLELLSGNPLRDGIAAATPLGDGQCRFTAINDLDGVDVDLAVSTHRKRDAARRGYQFGTRKGFERIYGDATRVRGIGSRAYLSYTDDISRQAALLILRGNDVVQVVLTGGLADPAQGRKQATAIAKVVLDVLAKP